MYKKINGFPNYSISDEGIVINDKFNRQLKQTLNNQGYLEVGLSNNGIGKTKNVHRLLAQAFIPNPENKCCVNHKDGDRRNNSLDNLEWNTNLENIRHSKNRSSRISKKKILKLYKSKKWNSAEDFLREIIKF